MRELLRDWFGPVLDTDGRRVKWRTSRPALLLCMASVMLGLATIVGAMGSATGAWFGAWWPATSFTAIAASVAANKRLRRVTTRPT